MEAAKTIWLTLERTRVFRKGPYLEEEGEGGSMDRKRGESEGGEGGAAACESYTG